MPRSAPRRRGADGRSNARPVLGGAAPGRGRAQRHRSTAPPPRRTERCAPCAGRQGKDAAIYLAARLPGLDSRRAAACFSSSSPVGAMVQKVASKKLGLRKFFGGDGSRWGSQAQVAPQRSHVRTNSSSRRPGRPRPGAGPAPPGLRRAHRCIGDARGACLLNYACPMNQRGIPD